MILLEVFLGFLRVGMFTFGGGYAAIPLIRDLVLSKGWLTEDAFTYMIAVSESTPGPIMVNLATYVGSSQAGIPGSILATLAAILPSFCVILLILVVFGNLIKSPGVQAFLHGMQPCVIGVIIATGLTMTARALLPAGETDVLAVVIGVILAAITAVYQKKTKKKMSPIRLILIAAVLGILFYGI